eukprot:CAMPEP_0179347982 /NCGR_PEP_ID=MMETSP0797-20121207/73457_1 /TAXON_ID=47934 /ORGANISM="Dinophysis acuminata, Strain DAEP01" /LENGTH=333 /DNA_ID=CAMNT_0021062753 /DNA_START=76 /DNA_END=1074 /DNA_ORIENTATION=+
MAIRPSASAGAQQRYQSPNSVHALEQRFSKQVHDLVEGVMDLNVPSARLDRSWAQLSELRVALLQAHGVPVAAKPPVTVRPPPKVAAHGQQAYRSPYASPYGREHPRELEGQAARALREGDQAAPREGRHHVRRGGLLQRRVRLHAHVRGLREPLVRRPARALEEAGGAQAAREALMAEFPDAFRQVEVALGGQAQAQAAQQAGVKRKGAGPDDPKSRLSQVMQLVLGRPTTKSDILYESALSEDGSGTYVATVHFPEYDQMNYYYGTPGATKKQAEMNAAEEALNQMQPIVQPLEEEHRAKKMRQSQGKLAQYKAGRYEGAARAVTNGGQPG